MPESVDEARNLAEALVERIRASGRAPREVAIAAGISPTTMDRKVRGETEFTVGELLRIVEVLGSGSGHSLIGDRTRGFAGTAGMLPRLLTVAEAARHLRVGSDWVYKRIERGEIPVVELGDVRKNQRIRESDLVNFIDNNTYGVRRGNDRRG